MKYTIIAVLLLITASKGMAQKNNLLVKNEVGTYQPYFEIKAKNGLPSVKFAAQTDTIEFFIPLQVHYIKIGDVVYHIVEHAPTIEKVEPIQLYRGGIIGGWNNAILATPNNSILY